jgi:transposase
VARATALLAVADGASYTAAAQRAGRRSGDGVAQLVARFNACGLAALDSQHGGGPPRQYGTVEQDRILAELRRPPDREQDGTATWSLTTLQRALRRAPDGLAHVSTFTILQTLHAADYTYQRSRTWCHTGTARRKRKDGTVVTTTDPDATPKKS